MIRQTDERRVIELPRVLRPLPLERTIVMRVEPWWVIPDAEYEHILSVIDNLGLAIERMPAVFAELDEEAIRSIIIVILNSHYMGGATGETFSLAGKTDILLLHERRAAFIAECKIWGGEKVLLEALDQLFSYATWRDTKTALILFSRRKDPSRVLETVRNVVPAQPSFRRHLADRNPASLQVVFSHPQNQEQEMTVTISLFSVPTQAGA